MAQSQDLPEDYHYLTLSFYALDLMCISLDKYVEKTIHVLHTDFLKIHLGGTPTCHSSEDKYKDVKKCRASTCGDAINFLDNQHEHGKIDNGWKNTDMKRWGSEEWSIALTFMNKGQDPKRNTGPSKTDVSGLLNLLEFCKKFNFDKTLVEKVRHNRNKLAHHESHQFQYTYDEFTSFVDDIIALMTDKEVDASADFLQQIEILKREDAISSLSQTVLYNSMHAASSKDNNMSTHLPRFARTRKEDYHWLWIYAKRTVQTVTETTTTTTQVEHVCSLVYGSKGINTDITPRQSEVICKLHNDDVTEPQPGPSSQCQTMSEYNEHTRYVDNGDFTVPQPGPSGQGYTMSGHKHATESDCKSVQVNGMRSQKCSTQQRSHVDSTTVEPHTHNVRGRTDQAVQTENSETTTLINDCMIAQLKMAKEDPINCPPLLLSYIIDMHKVERGSMIISYRFESIESLRSWWESVQNKELEHVIANTLLANATKEHGISDTFDIDIAVNSFDYLQCQQDMQQGRGPVIIKMTVKLAPSKDRGASQEAPGNVEAKDGDARNEADSIAVKTEAKTEPEEGKDEIEKYEDTNEDDLKVKQAPTDEKTLEELNTELHHKNHELNLINAKLSEKCDLAETETADLKIQVHDLEYQLDLAYQLTKLNRQIMAAAADDGQMDDDMESDDRDEEDCWEMRTDLKTIPEDQFRFQNVNALNVKTMEPPKPFYYPHQEALADHIIKRIELILQEFHNKTLDDFDDFDFQCYTIKSVNLREQTLQRLRDKLSGCFASSEYSDLHNLKEKTEKRVQTYNLDAEVITQLVQLKKEVMENPKTLYLVVADEAHCGIVSSGDGAENAEVTSHGLPPTYGGDIKEKKNMSAANHTLVNTWTDAYPNVFVLQVSSTPYSLKTDNSRFHMDDYIAVCRKEGDGSAQSDPLMCVVRKGGIKSPWKRINTQNNYNGSIPEVVRNPDAIKSLHFVKWSEGWEDSFQKGRVVKFLIPVKAEDGEEWKWITMGGDSNDEIRPMICVSDENKSMEVVIRGSNKLVEILSADEKWVLVVQKNSAKYDLGFVLAEKRMSLKNTDRFQVYMDFGEDVIELQSYGNEQGYLNHGTSMKGPRNEVTLMRKSGSWECVGLTSHDLSYQFVIDQWRDVDQSLSEPQYLSLNYCFNSMRNFENEKQLIRKDHEFVEILAKSQSISGSRKRKLQTDSNTSRYTTEDMIAAIYSYHILLMNSFRKISKLDNLHCSNLNEMLRKPFEVFGDYMAEKKQILKAFSEKLMMQTYHFNPVKIAAFNYIVEFYQNRAFEGGVKLLLAIDRNSDTDQVEDFYDQFVEIILFSNHDMNVAELCVKVFQKNQDSAVKKLFHQGFQYLKRSFKQTTLDLLRRSETFKLVDDLIMPEIPKEGLQGHMKVIRVPNEISGNMIYTTLCLARNTASSGQSYTFEVIRDYKNFNVKGYENLDKAAAAGEALHRIRQVLQPDRCTYIDKDTLEQCSCEKYSACAPKLDCIVCKHRHKQIETYTDLNHLPCILILLGKGRMGDTFPNSFNVMDLRLNSPSQHLSVLQQEMGRVCRYVYRGDLACLPYILVPQKLADDLEQDRRKHATLNGAYLHRRRVDEYIEFYDVDGARRKQHLGATSGFEGKYAQTVNARPSKKSFDFKNTDKFRNRLMLEGEPQIGKTGVYLNVIKRLREKLCPVHEEKEEDEYFSDSWDEDDEDRVSIPDNDLADRWIFPYKEDMRKGKVPTVMEHGKYVLKYGKYDFDTIKAPPKLMNKGPQNPKSSKPKSRPSHQTVAILPGQYRAYRANHCRDCRQAAKTTQTTVDVAGIEVRISVPYLVRLLGAIETLGILEPKLTQLYNDSSMDMFGGSQYVDADNPDMMEGSGQERPTLETWIFHPSYQRSKEACLNYQHQMVDESGQRCNYVQIIMVRAEEFQAYCDQWQTTHIIVALPPYIEEHQANVLEGGIGYVRLFIQMFAEHFHLPHITIIDDNVCAIYGVQTTAADGTEVVERNKNKVLEMKSVSLFSVLRSMASLLQGEYNNHPVPLLENERKINDWEDYTGPSSQYGVLGMQKIRPGIGRVTHPFKKTHVYSLVMLNVLALKNKGIRYQPWQAFADVHLNNTCDKEGLWVCKFNCYLMSKNQSKQWIPDVYCWPRNDTEVMNKVRRKESSKVKDTDAKMDNLKNLIKWIKKTAPPSRFEVVLPQNHKVKPFKMEVNDIMQKVRLTKGGSHHFAWFVSFSKRKNADDTLDDEIRKYLTSQPGIGGYMKHMLLLPATRCNNKGLKSFQSVNNMLGPMFVDGCTMDVVTSHNPTNTYTDYVLVYVEGTIKDPHDLEIIPNVTDSMPMKKDDNRIMKRKTTGEDEHISKKPKADQTASGEDKYVADLPKVISDVGDGVLGMKGEDDIEDVEMDDVNTGQYDKVRIDEPGDQLDSESPMEMDTIYYISDDENAASNEAGDVETRSYGTGDGESATTEIALNKTGDEEAISSKNGDVETDDVKTTSSETGNVETAFSY